MTREEFLKQFPKLLPDYKPASDVLAQIGEVDLVMFVGPSGVGKTTLMSKSGWPYVLSDVTRPPRPEEREGLDYFFRDDYEQIMSELASGRFVQGAVSPDGELYTTRATSYPQSGPATIAVVSEAVPVFRRLGFKRTFTAFVIPPTFEEWMRRLNVHNMPQDQLKARLNEARRSLEFALSDNQVHFILNDTIDRAVQEVRNLIDGYLNSEREKAGRQAAEECLQRISTSEE